MSLLICGISGACPPDEPVVNRNTGVVYEKRLIEEHLRAKGSFCPVDGSSLSIDDLIKLKIGSAPPRGVCSSIPKMLKSIECEWEGLMLEISDLRSALDTVKQELSQALYQHDAACRVIASLLKGEREKEEKKG